MKKIVLVALAVLMSCAAFAQFQAAPKARKAVKESKAVTVEPVNPASLQWAQIGTPFTTTDVYGNTVRLQDYLNDGKCVVIDYSCTWCGPCWNMHNSGLLEAIDALEDVQVIWVEVEESNTTAQIFGPQGGTGHNDMTYGNWTVTAAGDSIEYPIIDDDANRTCLRTCASLYAGYVPTIFFITPDGLFCDLNINNEVINYQDMNGSIANINALVQGYPRAGDNPLASISGYQRVVVGSTASFSANITSIDPVSSIEWTFQDGTPATATGATANCVWNTPGVHTVTLTVTNVNGSTTATMDVESYNMDSENLTYVEGSELETFIGTSREIFWGVMFPASYLPTGKSLNSVELIVGSDYSGRYEMIIYQGGTTAPTTEIYSHTYTLTGTNDYQTITPTSNVAIDGSQNLWIVFHTTNLQYPAAAVAAAGDVNSCLVSMDGSSWTDIKSASDGDLDYSWAIKAHLGNGTQGITTLSNAQVALYPNPTTSIVNVDAEGLQQVEVLDVDGRTVMTVNANKVDMSSLSNGVYMFRVLTNNGVSMQKVVKK